MSNLFIEKDGYIWSISMMEVVINRANYYADLARSRNEDSIAARNEEINYCKDNPDEAVDWFSNNMNISDIPEHRYRLVHRPEEPKISDLYIDEVSVMTENPYG